MIRFHSLLAWLLSSLGIALLMLSLVLVPTNLVLADGGGGSPLAGNGGCSGTARCNNPANPCVGRAMCGGLNVNCNNSTPGFDCSGCKCVTDPNDATKCICTLRD
jgi:hypothetical protein